MNDVASIFLNAQNGPNGFRTSSCWQFHGKANCLFSWKNAKLDSASGDYSYVQLDQTSSALHATRPGQLTDLAMLGLRISMEF